ncbi:MAG TPA: glycosyltransferase family 4 protein [Ilumatobacter sp.]|nr:glycosyltransferase family 4 protein [Ilumatobacter sp.]
MTDIIFVTQLVDPDDPVLGFTIRQIQALAQRARRVVVIANEVRHVPDDLGAEVVSLGKERGHSSYRRGLRYELTLIRLARELHRPALFAHMCPQYLTLGAAVALPTKMPAILWFTHPSDSGALGRATRLADVVVTALPGSFPRQSVKVRPIGHAVDLDRFPFTDPVIAPGSCHLLAVGRTSRVKGYPLMIEAIARARAAGTDATLTIVGPSTNDAEREHRTELVDLIERRDVADRVQLLDGVAHSQVAAFVHEATALVSATVAGSADKSVFEAMACGRPTLVSNPAFFPLMANSPISLRFVADDPSSLAERISAIANASPDCMIDVGRALRSTIERDHSLEHWAEQVVDIAEEVRSTAGRRHASPTR